MDTKENTTQGRASFTEKERRELIEEFKSSNLTQAAFCREWNLNAKTLARWLRVEREDKAVSFCEVELSREAVRIDEVRVCLPNRVEVVIALTSLEGIGTILREAAVCLG